ncbi:MAG: hypothetical protein GY928_10055 [Colwellia sp.]|nr:hypothetical protein [Colwellia sp.]
MNILNIVSILIGVAGLGGTVYFGLKASQLKKEKNTIDWHKAELGVDQISREVESKYKPELILSMSVPGRIVADLFILRNLKILPHYTIYPIPTKDNPEFLKLLPKHFVLETNKRKVAIPEVILKHKSRKLLVIDSAAVSGDTVEGLIGLLVNKGFPRENIFFVSLIATEAAVASKKKPDLYAYMVRDHKYRLPWGNFTNPWY